MSLVSAYFFPGGGAGTRTCAVATKSSKLDGRRWVRAIVRRNTPVNSANVAAVSPLDMVGAGGGGNAGGGTTAAEASSGTAAAEFEDTSGCSATSAVVTTACFLHPNASVAPNKPRKMNCFTSIMLTIGSSVTMAGFQY